MDASLMIYLLSAVLLSSLNQLDLVCFEIRVSWMSGRSQTHCVAEVCCLTLQLAELW